MRTAPAEKSSALQEGSRPSLMDRATEQPGGFHIRQYQAHMERPTYASSKCSDQGLCGSERSQPMVLGEHSRLGEESESAVPHHMHCKK